MYTYTAIQLQQKTFGELKLIAREFHIVPSRDRRYRQNWIDAIVGVNPPLLQLLEVSPAAEVVEQVQPIIETVETPSAAEVEPVQTLPIETVENSPGVERVTESNRNNFSGVERVTESNRNNFSGVERVTESNRNNFSGVEVDRVQKAIKVQAQEAIELATETHTGSGESNGNTTETDGSTTVANRLRNIRTHSRYQRFDTATTSGGSGDVESSIAKHRESDRVLAAAGNDQRGWRQALRSQPNELAAKTHTDVDVDPLQESIPSAAKTSPGVEVDRVSSAIEPAAKTSPGVEIDQAKIRNINYLDCPSCGTVRGLYATCPGRESVWETRCTHCDYAEPSIRHPFEDVRPFEVDRVREAAENSPGAEVDRVQQPIEEYLDIEELFQLESADCPACGGIDSLYARWSQEYAYGYWNIYCQRCDSTCCTDELPPCLRSEDNSTDSEDSSGVEIDPVLELPIEAAENSPRVDVDRGVTLSDRFLACYSPPQAQIIHFQSDADGQLSLLNFEIESVSEPPDPDDFESIEEFREAIARWDREHPEELAVSLDFFCEWVPCPDTWYESAEVVEVAPSVVIESFITCNFFIPTFDAWCDRFNRSDEPLDTGIYARLPKPKPPSFPPMAASQARAKCILNASQTHTKSILNASRTHTHCIVAGSSTQPTRSPPGGDASF